MPRWARVASLGEGVLLGGRVICPRHGWTFDLRSGVSASMPGPPVACRATRLCAGALEVEIP
jgi:nitrite reductase/ring-hydroxylating ferredoxin subunit